jgi:hypothetical protein
VPPAPKWARDLLGDDFFYDVVTATVIERDFGDDEAIYLKELTSLESLNLNCTTVTDAGLEHLVTLSKLRYLNLVATNVTPEGVKKLKRALPACEIVYGQFFVLPRRPDW